MVLPPAQRTINTNSKKNCSKTIFFSFIGNGILPKKEMYCFGAFPEFLFFVFSCEDGVIIIQSITRVPFRGSFFYVTVWVRSNTPLFSKGLKPSAVSTLLTDSATRPEINWTQSSFPWQHYYLESLSIRRSGLSNSSVRSWEYFHVLSVPDGWRRLVGMTTRIKVTIILETEDIF